MINKGVVPPPPDAPSILGHSSSTAIDKLSQPTEQEEKRNRERKVDDENKKDISLWQLVNDKEFRSIFDKALGKEKDSSQETQSI